MSSFLKPKNRKASAKRVAAYQRRAGIAASLVVILLVGFGWSVWSSSLDARTCSAPMRWWTRECLPYIVLTPDKVNPDRRVDERRRQIWFA